MKIELIKVDDKRIRRFCDWWKNGQYNPSDKEFSATSFKLAGIDFKTIQKGEELLHSVFEEVKKRKKEAIVNAVLILDSIYHTQIKDVIGYAICVSEINDKIGEILRTEPKDYQSAAQYINEIATARKKEFARNEYSFATKFCNMLNPKAYPIIDKYVVWLLYRYLAADDRFPMQYKNGKKITKSSFGRYQHFHEAYDEFIDLYNLSDLNYKEIDMFMWTYGKLLNKICKIKMDNDIKYKY